MKLNIETKRLLYAFYFPLFFLLILWVVLLVEDQFGFDFHTLGNYPLDGTHWYGVLLEPIIHDGVSHLWSNTLPLLFLLWSLFYFYGDIYFKVFLSIWILSGVITWLIGRPAYHIGASGLIYGISFFLFFSGIIRRCQSLMALSAIIAFVYGGIVWRMFPIVEYFAPEVSWEGHLSGAISGIVTALWFRKDGPQKRNEYTDSDDDIGGEEEYRDNSDDPNK